MLALKEDQATLHEAVAILFAAGQRDHFAGLHHDYQRTVEKNHGRLQVRQIWAVEAPHLIADLDPTGA